jgi:signal transduction histidine kinase
LAVGDISSAAFHLNEGLRICENYKVKGLKFDGNEHASQVIHFYLAEMAWIYLEKGQIDSALIYVQKAKDQKHKVHDSDWNYPNYLLGCIERQKGNYVDALATFRLAMTLARQNQIYRDTLHAFTGLATLFKMQGNLDSSIYYAQKVVQSVNPGRASEDFVESVNNLAELYTATGKLDSALRYTKISHALNDSIYNLKKNREILNYAFNEKLRQQEIISAQAKYKNRIQLYAVVGALLAMLFIAGMLWNNNRQRKKAYLLVQNQKNETEVQKKRVEEALDELKTTQAQLIHAEKMASLGELTTGIAHEIQNPLNFVNNFSEVNMELTAELRDELYKTEMEAKDKMNLGQLIDDLIQNEEKISHHGKRADAIVKSMLQHSRGSTGQKEPTDINALAHEYLTLACHGMRARDKSWPEGSEGFQAILQTNFDPGIDKINIVPQDIGKVLLNRYNNAFYTVMEKRRKSGDAYEPQVTVTTRLVSKAVDKQGAQKPESASRNSQSVIISVKDNGMGVPKKISDKIFQPFFTTKPTGQGTGLGLSLSYDIIKAHHGEINVETKEGEWTEFSISLPAE